MQGRYFKKLLSFPDELSKEAARLNHESESLSPGSERDLVSDKATQADIDALINKWVRSPGLQPPK